MTKTDSSTTAGRPNIAWRGAIEFSGFPVNVALYSRVKKQRTESFRTIAPSGQPVKTQYVDSATSEPFDSGLTRKGVEVAKGQFAILTEEAIEQISSGVKTTVAKPTEFVPIDSIDLSLAIERFAVRPDDKVPGSAQSVNIVWNGLRASQRAYMSQVSLRGGHDAILVVYADDRGMWAALLPFEAELYPVPTHEFEVDAKAEQLFMQVMGAQYDEIVQERFDHSTYESEYRARRQDAIDKIVAGVEVLEKTEQKPAVPDLMAVLEQAASKAKKPAAKKPAKKTPVAA